MNLIRSAVLMAAVAFTAACASKGSTADPENVVRRDRSVLTEEEIVASKATDAYGLVRSTRPAWLLSKAVGTRRQTASVYIDGNRVGGITALSQYNAGTIKEIRYLSADEATTRYGTGNGAGAIVVFLKR